MSFTYPAFLFALSAIAIPVIIHLFNFRKFKTVYFSNVRFLKEVKEETQAKSKLKHLLVLAARILTIIFLVLAFAQPFIPLENKKVVQGDKAISVFIDNSFSMEAINKNGTLLDEAKKRALEIASAYKPTDRFQLLTNDFEGRHQRLVNKDEFIELVEEVKISPSTHSISEIATRQSDLLNQSGIKTRSSFIISDFQKSTVDLSRFNKDTSIVFNFVPVTALEKNNVYIDTCWFETPVRQYDQPEKLHVRIKNASDKTLENNSIRLFINGTQKTPASYNLEPEGETEVVLSFASRETGIQHCRIVINDFPVTFDDQFFFSFNVSKNIRVLSINSQQDASESAYLNKLFGSDSLFIFSNMKESNLDYAALSGNNLIILNELKTVPSGLTLELRKFMQNGGSLLVFPNREADIVSYQQLFSMVGADHYERLDTANTKVDKINLEHVIYKDVFDKRSFSATNLDLPKVSEHFVISRATRSNEEYLLKLQNSDVFLNKYDIEKGKLYICASGLNDNFSNFAQHGIFVPTLYKIAMYSIGTQPLFYTIGKDEAIEYRNTLTGDDVFHIKGIENKLDVIPEHKAMEFQTAIFVRDQIKLAGNYELFANARPAAGLSFNFNRKESDLNCYNSDELKQEVTHFNILNINVLDITTNSITQSLKEMSQGKKLWKLCLILALIFLAAEVFLLRFMKG